MRGALGATLAALRAYRRVAQATSKRHTTYDRPDVGAPATPGAEGSSGETPEAQRRRSLIAIGAVSMVAVAALVASAIAVLNLGGGGQKGQPRTIIEPYGTVPAATSSAALVSGTVSGRPPADPLSAGSTPESTAPGASVVAKGSASAIAGGAPTVTTSAAATNTAAATTSPTLVDLCRSVVAAGNGWPSVLKGTDRATVIAAAGTKKNVLPYCTALVAG